MDTLTLVMAAGAYAGAEIAKKSADAALGAAFTRVREYVTKKLRLPVDPVDPVDLVDRLDADSARRAGLDTDPEVVGFGRGVFARSSALRRADLVGRVVRGARILWVDDEPQNNANERRLLAALGAGVEPAGSTQGMLAALGRERFDLILSDIARPEAPDAGIRMLAGLPAGAPPVVLYTGCVDESKGTPRGAFGIADRPETLLHLVLDVLERRRA